MLIVALENLLFFFDCFFKADRVQTFARIGVIMGLLDQLGEFFGYLFMGRDEVLFVLGKEEGGKEWRVY